MLLRVNVSGATVPEAKEPLTLKVFLAGSTQDRGYSLAESIIDSVATSLGYELVVDGVWDGHRFSHVALSGPVARVFEGVVCI